MKSSTKYKIWTGIVGGIASAVAAGGIYYGTKWGEGVRARIESMEISYDDSLLPKDDALKRVYARPPLTEEEHAEERGYGVLINGTGLNRDKPGVENAYRMLKARGFEDRNIFILSSNNPRGDDGKWEDDRKSITTRGDYYTLLPVFKRGLEPDVDGNDILFVFTAGDGKRYGDGEAVLSLEDGKYMPATQFRALLRQVKAGRYVVVSQQCFAGGFMNAMEKLLDKDDEELEGRGVYAVSATDDKHAVVGREFTGPLFEHLMKDPDLDRAVDYATRKFTEMTTKKRIEKFLYDQFGYERAEDLTTRSGVFRSKYYPEELTVHDNHPRERKAPKRRNSK